MANGLTQKGNWYYATTRYKDVNGKWKTKYLPTKVPADGRHKKEAKEKERTGIRNLKVGYTKVFGYYIEITKSFLKQVPENYIRKQTLTGAERFITEELKQIEDKILGSEEKVIALEYEEFTKIRNEIAKNIERLQLSANTISNVDVLTSLAIVAEKIIIYVQL